MEALTELNITEPTEFEKVMARIKKETLETETSLHNENYMRQIIKEIASVYFFLRKEGLGYSPITIKEFEVTQQHLLNLARQKTSQPVIGFFRHDWRYFLRNKFFSSNHTLFGGWHNDNPWNEFSYISFNPSDAYAHLDNRKYDRSLPPNLKELAKEIMKKRYTNKKTIC